MGDLVAQLLTESLLLAVFGGSAGLLLAAVVLRVPIQLPTFVPLELDLGLDLTVLSYAAGITLLAGLVLGLAPALQGAKPDMASTLKEEGAGGGQPGKLKLRNSMIGAQVATSTVLLVAAGLFLRSFQETLAVDPGFGHDPAAMMTMRVPTTRFDEQQGRRYVERLIDRFEQVPGVLDVGLISTLYLGVGYNLEEFNVDGTAEGRDQSRHRRWLTTFSASTTCAAT